MRILFIHQNFPGQFVHLAPALAARSSNEVVCLTLKNTIGLNWKGVKIVNYRIKQGSTKGIHPWAGNFEVKMIRAQAVFEAALDLKKSGFTPDIIVAHPGWGESLFLKEVWPGAGMGIYCEFFYHPAGYDVGFDPEFKNPDPGNACKVRVKNCNDLLQFQTADAGLSPTHWQASTYPEQFRKKITVVHDGINLKLVCPRPDAWIKLNGNIRLTKDDEVITFVNRNLEPLRGYHIFMRSLPELLKQRPDARILIIGGDSVSYGESPPEGEKWKNIFLNEIRNDINPEQLKRIHFLGNIPYQYFLLVLQISSVHVYLTYPFVLSWSLLEAMGTECAVVASNTPPLHEVIHPNETGLLVDFFSPRDLTETVCSLLDNPEEQKRLGKNARAFALENYDLETICLPEQRKWVYNIKK